MCTNLAHHHHQCVTTMKKHHTKKTSCNYWTLTFLVLDSTVCPAASANRVNKTFADSGDNRTLFGCDLSTVC